MTSHLFFYHFVDLMDENHVSYTKFHGEFVVKMIFWLISIMSLVGCTENKTDDTSVDTDSGVVANGSGMGTLSFQFAMDTDYMDAYG